MFESADSFLMLEFLKALRIPSSFEGDPYGWVTNQMSHTYAGILSAAGVSHAWFYLAGEWPYKMHVIVLLAAGYFLFELLAHWRGFRGLCDSLADTWFFGIGVSIAMATGSEYQMPHGEIVLIVDPPNMALPLFLSIVSLIFGVWVRGRQ